MLLSICSMLAHCSMFSVMFFAFRFAFFPFWSIFAVCYMLVDFCHLFHVCRLLYLFRCALFAISFTISHLGRPLRFVRCWSIFAIVSVVTFSFSNAFPSWSIFDVCSSLMLSPFVPCWSIVLCFPLCFLDLLSFFLSKTNIFPTWPIFVVCSILVDLCHVLRACQWVYFACCFFCSIFHVFPSWVIFPMCPILAHFCRWLHFDRSNIFPVWGLAYSDSNAQPATRNPDRCRHV